MECSWAPYSFTHTISDGPVITAPTTVTIAVQNSLPVTSDNSYRVHHDGTLTINAVQGFLADDYDPDADTLTIAAVTQPANGTLAWNADGSFTYTPDAGYVGSDSFTYKLSDATRKRLGIRPDQRLEQHSLGAPQLFFGAPWQLHQRQRSQRDDTEWDGDTMQPELVGSGVQHGTLSFNSNGSFTYTPNSDYSGSDSFSYRVYDGRSIARRSPSISTS